MFVTWPDVISVGAVLGDGRGHSSTPPPKHAQRSPGRSMPAPHFAKLTPDKWLMAVRVALLQQGKHLNALTKYFVIDNKPLLFKDCYMGVKPRSVI